MLEGGQFDPKGMLFIVQPSDMLVFPLGIWHGLLGDLEEVRDLIVV